MQPSPTDALRTALSAVREVLARVRDDQWDAPTPCTEWTVAQLTAHLISGNRMFAARLRGDEPAPVADPDGDRLTAYDEAAEQLVAAFGADDAMTRIVSIPFGTVPGVVAWHIRLSELLVHGWDLARATGQQISVPDALVEQELVFSRNAIQQLPPDRSPFGPPQPVDPAAPPLDQLVALLGRTV